MALSVSILTLRMSGRDEVCWKVGWRMGAARERWPGRAGAETARPARLELRPALQPFQLARVFQKQARSRMDGRPSLDLRQASEALAIEALVADNGERSDPRRGRDGRARRTREPNDEEAYELENSGLLDGDERSGISDGEEDYRKATRRRHRIKADSDSDNEEEGSFAAIIRRVRVSPSPPPPPPSRHAGE